MFQIQQEGHGQENSTELKIQVWLPGAVSNVAGKVVRHQPVEGHASVAGL